ncbi:MAG: RDD family protein [Epsilonproteobacteria bacterium]|nr:RDD family protein [Campylobacterota bacterium]
MVKIEELASLNKRTLSFIIDDIVVSFLFLAILYDKIKVLSSVESFALFINHYGWLAIILKILYHGFFIGYNGMTPGKYIVKIKLVSKDSGKKLSYPMAFARAIARIGSEFIFYMGFLLAFFTPYRQTFHDLVTNSVVVDVKDKL